MKLKVLGMCAIASLLYGENVFAYGASPAIGGDSQNLNDTNATTTQDENSNVSENITNYGTATTQNSRWIHAKNRRNARKNEKRRANSIDNSQTPHTDQNLYNVFADLEDVSDWEDVSDSQNQPYNQSENLHKETFILVEKLVEQDANVFSRLIQEVGKHEDDVSLYYQEEKKMNTRDRLKKAKDLKKSNKDLIAVLDETIANFEDLQKILQDLKINEKIIWLKDKHAKIESLLKDVDIGDLENLVDERFQRREQKKAAKAEKIKKKEESRRPSERAGQDIDWQAINRYLGDLFKFIEMIGLRKPDFKSLITHGDSCFGHKNGLMFDPGQNGVDPMSKNILKQIYEVSSPEAEEAWSETKEMIRKAYEFVSAFSSERSKLNEEISKAKETIAKSSKVLAKKTKLENDLRNNKRLPPKQKASKEQEIAELNNQIISDSNKEMILEDLKKKESRVKELENMISDAYRDLKLENLESKIKTLSQNVARLLKQRRQSDLPFVTRQKETKEELKDLKGTIDVKNRAKELEKLPIKPRGGDSQLKYTESVSGLLFRQGINHPLNSMD